MKMSRFDNGNGNGHHDTRPQWEQDDGDQVGLDPADAVEPEPKVTPASQIKKPQHAPAPTDAGPRSFDPVKVVNVLTEVWTNPNWHCFVKGQTLVCERVDKARNVKQVLTVEFRTAELAEIPLVPRK